VEVPVDVGDEAFDDVVDDVGVLQAEISMSLTVYFWSRISIS
jgi:hypothetical protein